MHSKTYKELPNSVIHEIREVEKICKAYEPLQGTLFLDASLNFTPDLISTFLCYEDEKLVSLLYIFAPSTTEAEISGYTLPAYRQKGCFRLLLQEAVRELAAYGIEDILFVCEPDIQSSHLILQKWNAAYAYTEYAMIWNPDKGIDTTSFQTRLHTADIKDIDLLVDMSQLIFGERTEEARNRIQNIFQSPNRIQYILMLGDQWVGIGRTVAVQADEVAINGLGILHEYQGQGLGKQLLGWILSDLIEKGYIRIMLEVNSKNENAFRLYQQIGFKVELAYEYHRIKLNNLHFRVIHKE